MKKAMSILLAMVFVVCCVVPVAAQDDEVVITVTPSESDQSVTIPSFRHKDDVDKVIINIKPLNDNVYNMARSTCYISFTGTGRYYQNGEGTHTSFSNYWGEFEWFPYDTDELNVNGHMHSGTLERTELDYNSVWSWECGPTCNGTSYDYGTHTRVCDATCRYSGYLTCINP